MNKKPEMRRDASGASGHVSAKPSICNAGSNAGRGALCKSGAYAGKDSSLTMADLPGVARQAAIRSVVCLCALALATCFAPPEAAAQEPSAAASAPSAAGELYLFNDSGRTLISSNQIVTDNGKVLASLPRQTYVRLPLSPGEHLLRPDPYLWKQEVRLQVTPGSTHYVVVAYKPERSWALPLAGPPLLLHQLTQQEAEPLLKEMKAQ
jgi:hypothetical protein